MSTGGRSSSDVTRSDVAGTRGGERSGTERIDTGRSGTERISAERGTVQTSIHGGPRLFDRARDEEAQGGIAAEEHILHRLREREQARSRADAGGAGPDRDRAAGPGPDGTDDDGHLSDGGAS